MLPTNATLPYVRAIAEHCWREACAENPDLAHGLTATAGQLFSVEVAVAHGYTALKPVGLAG
jgi:alanine dehydrogenase